MSAQAQSFKQILGAPPSTFSPTDSVLIIIDAQNEYANGKLKISALENSRPNILSLLSAYRKADGHIVHVLHQVPNGAPVFTPETEIALEFEELRPKADASDKEVTITKQVPGSFTGTNLKEIVQKSGKSKVLLVGYMAHICVSTTAREGMQSGFDVGVAGDAIGDRDIPGASAEELVRVVLAELGDCFATVVSTKDVVGSA
ncbi:Isochorismatase hydrolase [Ascobolus immersus RN42]|uniref:Isochorismatase hydrolase n=1 Tax=Ascobolus immersus RN42 TaxID=1160509 RepID=A0A3N4IL84_ASCIM|nr:Isochorismatase hydrolase [Ascobolus immersus RN42]